MNTDTNYPDAWKRPEQLQREREAREQMTIDGHTLSNLKSGCPDPQADERPEHDYPAEWRRPRR